MYDSSPNGLIPSRDSSNNIENIYAKFFEDGSRQNGLMLVDSPTGSSKTYSAYKYIIDSVVNHRGCGNKKFLFITSRKANLKEGDLRKLFDEANKDPSVRFDDLFLYAHSMADSVREGFRHIARGDCGDVSIPAFISGSEKYTSLQKKLKNVEDYENSLKQKEIASNWPVIRELRDRTNEEIMNNLEPEFRKFAAKAFGDAFNHYWDGLLTKTHDKPMIKDKLEFLRANKDWKWLGIVYPVVFTSEKRIIFMTVDKFIRRYNTIIAPSFVPCDDADFLEQYYIFLDEFDSTKDVVLRGLIEDGLNGNLSLIELFDHLYAYLNESTHVFPQIVYDAFKKGENINRLKDIANSISGTFPMFYNFKLKSTNSSVPVGNFLFSSHLYSFSVFEKSKSNKNSAYCSAVFERDDEDRFNYVEFDEDVRDDDPRFQLRLLISRISGFFRQFERYLLLALKPVQDSIAFMRPREIITPENAVRSLLADFGLGYLSPVETSYVVRQVFFSGKTTRGPTSVRFGRLQRFRNLSFCEGGLDLFSVLDDPNRALSSEIKWYSFPITPERILVRCSQSTKVIGISATASIDSVISNYDLNYVKSVLGDSFVTLSSDDRKLITDEFVSSQGGYDGVNINVKLLSSESDGPGGYLGESSWFNLFECSGDGPLESIETARKCFFAVETCYNSDKDKDNFHKNRIFILCSLFKEFLLHEDIHSLLCVLTAYPSESSVDRVPYDKELITGLFKDIAEWCSDKFGIKPFGCEWGKDLFILNSDEHSDTKSLIDMRLRDRNNKVFVFSVYEAIGTGVNLQYKYPSDMRSELVVLNTDRDTNLKDFDAIYLAIPRNILSLSFDGSGLFRDLNFVKLLFQVSYLPDVGEITVNQYIDLVRWAFRKNQGRKNDPMPVPLLNLRDSVLAATKVIIQALGRLCRTFVKSRNIYIFAPEDIAFYIDSSVCDEHTYNYEFLSLVDECKKVRQRLMTDDIAQPKDSKLLMLERKASNNSDLFCHAFHSGFLDEGSWDDAKIEEYVILRKYLMKYGPCYSPNDKTAYPEFYSCFCESPAPCDKYYYRQEYDYRHVEVSFSDPPVFSEDLKGPIYECSAADCRLEFAMEDVGLKNFFEGEDYATGFSCSLFHMTPFAYNVYKGILGEVCGKYYLETYFPDIKLVDLESDIYERFDFRVQNSDCFVDFKNWNERFRVSASEYEEKMAAKADLCNAKCAIIINVYAKPVREYDIEIWHSSGGAELIAVPYLIDSNHALNMDAYDRLRSTFDEFCGQI